MALCDSHSGFLWLELTLSGFHWFSLALSGSFPLSLFLSGSLWLSVTPTLALTAILWHTLALSGSLSLFKFAYTVLDQLSGPLLDFQRRWQAHALYPGLAVTKAMRRWRSTVAPQRPPQWALRGPASNPRKQGLSAFTVRRQKLPSLRKRKF